MGTSRNVGRPRTRARRAEIVVRLYLTPDEKAAIARYAAAVSLTMGQAVRTLVLPMVRARNAALAPTA